MRKNFVVGILALLIVFNAFPLGVDINEIKTGKRIEFVNFTGPSKQYTVTEVKGWGTDIASDLRTNKKEGRYKNQFVVIHAIDPADTDKTKFDADIFVITRNCSVRHIDTIRLVIAGYLESQYGYKPKDSVTLAVFITYYNAVYRGNLTYFAGKYKKAVMSNVSSGNVGIALHYKEWPGTTRMIIPLTESANTKDLSSLDTSLLSDEKVINSMRKEDDKKVKERDNLVDIKEREVKEDKRDVEKDKKEVEKKKETIAKDKEAIDKEKKEIAKEKEEAKKITDAKEKAVKEKEIAAKEKEVVEKEKTVADTTKEVEKKESEIKKDETAIARKESEIAKETETLDKDTFIAEVKKDPEKKADELYEKEKELEKREDALKDKTAGDKKIYAGKFYYLKVKEYLTGGHYNNDLYILDAPTLAVVSLAQNANICGRSYDIRSNGIVVITHSGSHTAGHNLTLLEPETLAPKLQGTTNIFHRSFIEIKDNFIYAITNESDSYFLGKFNQNLELVSKSSEKVDADTFLSFFKDKVYVNGSDKKILVLNGNTLATENSITP